MGAIFRSDRVEPVLTGLARSEVRYYKAQVQAIVDLK